MRTAFPCRLLLRVFTVVAATTVGFVFFAAAPVHAGANDSVTGWLWSGTAGWISMNCTNFGTCGVVDYGVDLDYSGSGDGELTGWAWSETFGWICFGSTCPDDIQNPEGSAQNYAKLYEYVDDGSAGGRHWQFYGWARIMNLGDLGWISLNCYNVGQAACGANNYYTSYDIATGFFSNVGDLPNVNINHFGWSGNDDGTGIGWVDFSLAHANWAPPLVGPVLRPVGIYEPANSPLPGSHPSSFEIVLPNVFSPIDYLLECVLELPNGDRRILSKLIEDTYFGFTEQFFYQVPETDRNTDAIERGELWYIETCRLLTAPTGQVCTQDSDCSAGFCRPDPAGGGNPDQCRLLADMSLPKPLYVHDNSWTLYGATDDFYRAVKCYASFADQFFRNANRCDFTGDAAFSMAMSKGIPIERDCQNGIDDDGNGETDCDDRFCKGLSYLCKPEEQRHLPTRCVWAEAGTSIIRCDDLIYERGDLCCNDQPVADSSPFNHVVNGLECEYGSLDDGYFDCDCVSQADFDANPNDDCFAPGHQTGGLCCERIIKWPGGEVIGSRVEKK